MGSDEDRFGMPESAIRAALAAHGGIVRAGSYVPTRAEVRTEPIDWIADIVSQWVWESPSELTPSSKMIAHVIMELESRADAGSAAVQSLIAELRAY